jgi:hypothetical protein
MVNSALKQKNIDIRHNMRPSVHIPDRRRTLEAGFSSVLFSRGKQTESFFTEDSKLYVTPREAALLTKGILLDRGTKKWDSLSSRIEQRFVRYQPSSTSVLVQALSYRKQLLQESVSEASRNFLDHFTLVRLWNMSIVGAILFGMVSMTFVYRYLGQGASAADAIRTSNATTEQSAADTDADISPKVLGDQSSQANEVTAQVIQNSVATNQQELEKEIRKIVKGYPIEDMVPYIAKQDRTVAAFLIGIAKQESSWGEHVPVLNGQDCYNYWGFRLQRKLMGTGGHTCFNSRQDAVETVAKRIKSLVDKSKITSPASMVGTWKCGSDCSEDSPEAVKRWIDEVTVYFDKLNG